jgi:hypothetical protein
MAYPIIRPIILYGAALRRFDRLMSRADRGYFRRASDPERDARCDRIIDDYHERERAKGVMIGMDFFNRLKAE